jgi:hypothetical protein
VDEHAPVIDVTPDQMKGLGETQASGIDGHQDDPVLQVSHSTQEPFDLGRGQNDG